jgi:hypothetical protein
MNSSEIAHRRLHSQHITGARFVKPEDVVHLLIAVQAQDYYGAQWALGLRMQAATHDDIEAAFNEGAILRTHLLRPTRHFVTPDDIRWLLDLTAPRVHAVNAYMYRQVELEPATFKRSNDALAGALQGRHYLTRDELRAVLKKAGIIADVRLRMSYLLMRAELDGVICSGPRRGKQFTYALLEEKAPDARTLERDEALAELALRYFTSRGPATVQDFAKWSGLKVADANSGLNSVKAQLQHEQVGGQTCWFVIPKVVKGDESPTAHLLSVYDEYISGYKNRNAMIDEKHAARVWALSNALTFIIVVEGQVVGTWKRTLRKDSVLIEPNIFARLTKAAQRAVVAAAHRYGEFLGLAVELA